MNTHKWEVFQGQSCKHTGTLKKLLLFISLFVCSFFCWWNSHQRSPCVPLSRPPETGCGSFHLARPSEHQTEPRLWPKQAHILGKKNKTLRKSTVRENIRGQFVRTFFLTERCAQFAWVWMQALQLYACWRVIIPRLKFICLCLRSYPDTFSQYFIKIFLTWFSADTEDWNMHMEKQSFLLHFSITQKPVYRSSVSSRCWMIA